MDASAVVSSGGSRPTLGRCGVGPLGNEHSEMIEEILSKQRRTNPLKRFYDGVNDFFLKAAHCFEVMMPTRVSPELLAVRRWNVASFRIRALFSNANPPSCRLPVLAGKN